MNVLVFVSSGCPHCPKAINLTKRVIPDYHEHGISYRKVRVKTLEGKELSKKYNVRRLPTILFLTNGVEVKRFIGTLSEYSFRSEVKKLLGLKKSLLLKIKGLFR